MFMHKLGLALGRLPSELDAQMTRTDYYNWVAFYRLWPFGQEVDDLRIMTLRADIHSTAQATQYSTGKQLGCKGGTKPERVSLSELYIVKRHGIDTNQKGRSFADMTLEETDKHMRSFVRSMKRGT